MNLADYVSELLGTHDEVSMPGLGYFAFTHVYGYYNAEEEKLCPPRNEVAYNSQLKDDDLLAQYVADKKKISVATSKYFAEKFVSDLKEKASSGDFIFSNLGLFRTENGKLVFHPNKSLPDHSFYGYPSITVKKLQPIEPEPVEADHTEPVYDKPVYTEEIAQPELIIPIQENNSQPVEENLIQPVEEIISQPEAEEQVERRKSLPVWLILSIIVGVIALSILGIFLVNPALFNKSADKPKQITNVPVAKPDTDTVKTDTAKIKDVAKDSTTKAIAPVTPVAKTNDTLTRLRFEVFVGAFKTVKRANVEIAHYAAKGVKAKIVGDAPGRLLKISVGTYFTEQQADSAKIALIKSKKIYKDSYVNPIKPKK